MTRNKEQRAHLIKHLSDHGIMAVFHYLPLHLAPFWTDAYKNIHLPVTEAVSECLLRLPLYYELNFEMVDRISEHIQDFCS